MRAAITHSSIAIAVCDHDFAVRFFNPAIGRLIDRAAASAPDAPSPLHGMTLLSLLGVEDVAAMTDILAHGGWYGMVSAGAPGIPAERCDLRISIESFRDAGSAAGWLITVSEQADQAAPARMSDRDLIVLSDKLTVRERDVMLALQEGASNKAIALRLHISPRTVEFHRARIMQRFAAKSVVELIQKVIGDTQRQLR